MLAAIGAGIGLVLADWFSARLFALFVNGRDLQLSVSPDWRVLAFTAMVAILACCLAGLAPALRAVRVNVNPALKEVRAHGHRRFGRALVDRPARHLDDAGRRRDAVRRNADGAALRRSWLRRQQRPGRERQDRTAVSRSPQGHRAAGLDRTAGRPAGCPIRKHRADAAARRRIVGSARAGRRLRLSARRAGAGRVQRHRCRLLRDDRHADRGRPRIRRARDRAPRRRSPSSTRASRDTSSGTNPRSDAT